MHTDCTSACTDAATTDTSPASPRPLPLIPYEEYQQSRAHVFPSVDSLRWFERQHRPVLLAAGALCMPAGRKMVIPASFDGVVIEVGLKLAATRGGRG